MRRTGAGFTMVELLVSLTLLGLVLLFVLNLFPSSMATVRNAEQRYRAGTLAGSILEQQEAARFDDLPVGLSRDLTPQIYDQVEYRLRLQVLSASGDPQYLRTLRVTVEWTVRDQTRQVVREMLLHHLPSQL